MTLDAVLGATKPANVLQVGGNDGTNAYAIPLASGGSSIVVSGSVSAAVTGVTGVVEVSATSAANTALNPLYVSAALASGSEIEITDGTNVLFLTAHPGIIAGAGTAGTPAGGVVSVQGVSGGQAVPVVLNAETTKVIGTVNQGTSPWTTSSVPVTSGGLTAWDIFGNTLTDSSQEVKSSPGQFYGYNFFNPNSVPVYLMIYSASETCGSATNRVLCMGIPAGAGANIEFDLGIACATTIYAAISTAVNSAAAPSTQCVGTLYYD